MFMFEDLVGNEKVSTWNEFKSVTGSRRSTTARYAGSRMSRRQGWSSSWPRGKAGDWLVYQPKHYLQKWHIECNPDANTLANEDGFDEWWEALHSHFWWTPTLDMDKPTLHGWRYTEFSPTTRIWERNLYYWKVDTAGNQLPYVDRIVSTVVEKDVYTLNIISGAQFPRRPVFHPPVGDLLEEPEERAAILAARSSSIAELTLRGRE